MTLERHQSERHRFFQFVQRVGILLLALLIGRVTTEAQVSMEIGSGSTLEITGTINIDISGNWTNGGTFTAGSSTVKLNGTSTQTLSTTTTFNNLVINNSAGITLLSNEIVNGTLTLTSGNISTGAYTLTIGGSGLITRTSGHIVGNLKRTYTEEGTKTFAVGTANGYSPVAVHTTDIGDFTVKATQGAHPNTVGGNVLQRYWTLTSAGITTADLTFQYLDGDVVGTEANYVIGKYSGGAWSFPGGSVNTSANTATINGVTSFSDWTLGEPGATPVELASFTASVHNNVVHLKWQTATEVNNYGFEVERSSKAGLPNSDWETVGFVEGHGTSNAPKEYSFVDNKVSVAGKYYYRLKQIDRDGNLKHSPEIEVTIDKPAKYELSQNYPNPFNPSTTIRFDLPEVSYIKLTVYNTLGEEVKTLVSENKQPGYYEVTLNISELAGGVYFYRLQAGNFIQVRKMLFLK